MLLCGGAFSTHAAGASARAAEIAAFRMTGYEGYVSLGYLSDDFATGQPGFGSLTPRERRQVQTDLRGEIFVMTHSYVYHPKFVALDIGGGLVYEVVGSEFDGQSARSSQPLYNLSVHAAVLADKPYRGTLFYEHLNPTLSVSPAEILTRQTRRFGGSFSLLAPITPVPMTFEASRSHSRGSSALRVLDDRNDQFVLRADRDIGRLGRTQMRLESQQQASSSGSAGLPIQQSQLRSQAMSLDTQLRLGAKSQYELFNSLGSLKQTYTLEQGRAPRTDNLRFSLNYRGTHSPELLSFAAYHFNRARQNAIANDVHSASLSTTWLPSKAFAFTAGLRGDSARATLFSTQAWGIDGSVRYERPLPLGNAQVSYAARYDLRDQTAAAASTAVVGERLSLTGIQPVALARTRVTAGSVTVSNAGRSQVFVEGIDYTLTVVGITTRLQRLLGGRILDGEELLLDYGFDIGGTYASSQLAQNLSLNWTVLPRWNIYLRYADAAPRVTSGSPSSPLNTVHSTLIGSRAELPLKLPFEVQLGGSLERENHRETIAPFVRTEGEVSLQGELYRLAGADFRVAGRRARIEADNQLQTINLSSLNLAFGWRPALGMRVSATVLFERDTGGLELRERKTGSLRAVWQFRRLTLSADLLRTHEAQGGVRRDRTVGSLILRRDFSL